MTPLDKLQVAVDGHICNLNDMSMEQWLDFFSTQEQADVALESSLWDRVRPICGDKVDVAVGFLASDGFREGLSEEVSAPLAKKKTVRQTTAGPAGAQGVIQSAAASVTVAAPVIITDKGEFYRRETWVASLKDMFSDVDGFDSVLAKALLLCDIDPSFEYLSKAAKNKIMRWLKDHFKDDKGE